MKNLAIALFAGITFLASTNTFAQSDTNKPVIATLTDTTFLVNGVCNMCKFTIESAAQINGVEQAEWNVETKVLSLSYFPNNTTVTEISKAVNKSGYDTEYQMATEEDYKSLHKCCYYRDPEVINDHK